MRRIPILAIDTETTGLDTAVVRAWEIGFASRDQENRINAASALINPSVPVPQEIIELSHISPELLEKITNSETFPEKYPKLLAKTQQTLEDGGLFLTYNGLDYDLPLLRAECARYGLDPLPVASDNTLDAIIFIRESLPKLRPKTLSNVAAFFSVPAPDAHRAWADAKTTLLILEKFMHKLPDDPKAVLELQAQIKARQDADRVLYSYWFRRKDNKLYMACGKHAGLNVEAVPRNYWFWMLKAQREYEKELSVQAKPVDWVGPVDKAGKKLEGFPNAVLEVANYLIHVR